MANENGQVYGLTILSPIIEDQRLDIEHEFGAHGLLPAGKTLFGSLAPVRSVDALHFAGHVFQEPGARRFECAPDSLVIGKGHGYIVRKGEALGRIVEQLMRRFHSCTGRYRVLRVANRRGW